MFHYAKIDLCQYLYLLHQPTTIVSCIIIFLTSLTFQIIIIYIRNK